MVIEVDRRGRESATRRLPSRRGCRTPSRRPSCFDRRRSWQPAARPRAHPGSAARAGSGAHRRRPTLRLIEGERDMELRHLRYFVAVAEELHFRRAADRLHVAQPAVSEQIRKLEQELGVRLFDRTPRSVALTVAGVALLEEARHVLRHAEVAQQAARNAGDSATMRLRIGYLPDSLPGERAARAAPPRRLGPRVEVALETGPAHPPDRGAPRPAARCRRHRACPPDERAADDVARRAASGCGRSPPPTRSPSSPRSPSSGSRPSGSWCCRATPTPRSTTRSSRCAATPGSSPDARRGPRAARRARAARGRRRRRPRAASRSR